MTLWNMFLWYFHLLLVLSISICCCRKITLVSNQYPEGKQASVQLQGIEIHSMDENASVTWKLKAHYTSLSDQSLQSNENDIRAYDFQFTSYNSLQKPEYILSAHKGRLDRNQEKLYLEKDVVLLQKGVIHLYSDELEYDIRHKILRGEHPVKMEEKQTRTLCQKGIKLDLKNNHRLCRSARVLHWNRSSRMDQEEVF